MRRGLPFSAFIAASHARGRASTPSLVVAVLLVAAGLTGCLAPAAELTASASLQDGAAPFLGYVPPEPDTSLLLEEIDMFLAGAEDVLIHARVVKPQGDGPFPVIVEFTPYTAPGDNVVANNLLLMAEPACDATGCDASAFVHEFVRRGYAFAFADVRGTGDSSGCLSLRGQADIDDSARLIEALGTAPWSNGAVGYIGASYPGSEAHMAALAASEHAVPYLKAVVPVVASTSFYHYHHNDGVPYSGNHALGGTNAGYTQNAISPTVSPQSPNYVTRLQDEAGCSHKENIVDHGGLDQSGAYYDWWQERNLRARAATVDVPVLMAQGLADWNVKPDHIATWFNDLPGQKTLIAGQWAHAYPRSVSTDCAAFETPAPSNGLFSGSGPVCDPAVPYGKWWEYVTAFFDTFLKGEATGMFTTNVAWVQDDLGGWHRSSHWPLLPDQREELVLHLTAEGDLAAAQGGAGELVWKACGRDRMNMGVGPLSLVEDATGPCDEEGANGELVFESAPFERTVIVSGVPLLDLVVRSTAATTHLVAVLDVLGPDGEVLDSDISYADGARQNYGYLNPIYRAGLETPQDLPAEAYPVTIDLYPQEDVVETGQRLRLTIRSHDNGRSIEAFEPGENALVFGAEGANRLVLPLRPDTLQGVRLDVPTVE